jgi:hypothetical protein
MLTYNALKDKAKEFLAVTGLKIEEFARLLPAFESGYRTLYPADKTAEGKTRRRQPGGGPKASCRALKTNFGLGHGDCLWFTQSPRLYPAPVAYVRFAKLR